MNVNEAEKELPKNIKKKRGPKPRPPLECEKCGYKCQLKWEFEKHLRRKTPCNKVIDHEYVVADNKKKLGILLQKWNGLPKSKIFKKELNETLESIEKLIIVMKNHDKDLSAEDKVSLDEQLEKYKEIISKIIV